MSSCKLCQRLLKEDRAKSNTCTGKAPSKSKVYKAMIPFINGFRMQLDDFDASAGTSTPKNLTAMSWCDVDLAQIATIVSDIERLTENLILALKQKPQDRLRSSQRTWQGHSIL